MLNFGNQADCSSPVVLRPQLLLGLPLDSNQALSPSEKGLSVLLPNKL